MQYIQKPNFSEMSAQELVDAYNSYSSKWRKTKFASKEVGIASCEAEFLRFAKSVGWAILETPPEAKEVTVMVNDEDDFMPAQPDYIKAALVSLEEDKKTKKTKVPRSSSKESMKIIIKVPRNPRREGTDAYDHFEAMQKAKTVGEYLSSFEDRRKAQQWLSNTIRDGHVELADGGQ
jgi:hypothetical protein